MKFSIVIPVFNRRDLLLRAVKSVIAQTLTEWELIIADDASTEDIRSVVTEVNDPRIRYERLEKNGGNAAARTLGAKCAKSEYVAFLDSDDSYHNDFLEKMSTLIERHHRPGFLWCNVNRVHADGTVAPNSFPPSWKPMSAENPYKYFLKGIYFGTDFGFTVRRDCFEKVGFFDLNLRVAVDTDFVLRIVKEYNFAYTDEILVDTYEHSGVRVRKNVAAKASSYDVIYAKHKNFIDADAGISRRWRYRLMWINYHASNKKNARRFWISFFRNLAVKPIFLGLIFELLPVETAIKVHKKIAS